MPIISTSNDKSWGFGRLIKATFIGFSGGIKTSLSLIFGERPLSDEGWDYAAGRRNDRERLVTPTPDVRGSA